MRDYPCRLWSPSSVQIPSSAQPSNICLPGSPKFELCLPNLARPIHCVFYLHSCLMPCWCDPLLFRILVVRSLYKLPISDNSCLLCLHHLTRFWFEEFTELFYPCVGIFLYWTVISYIEFHYFFPSSIQDFEFYYRNLVLFNGMSMLLLSTDYNINVPSYALKFVACS